MKLFSHLQLDFHPFHLIWGWQFYLMGSTIFSKITTHIHTKQTSISQLLFLKHLNSIASHIHSFKQNTPLIFSYLTFEKINITLPKVCITFISFIFSNAYHRRKFKKMERKKWIKFIPIKCIVKFDLCCQF